MYSVHSLSCLFTDRHVLNGPSLTAPLTVDTNSAAASLAGDFSSVSFEKIPINNTKKSAKNDSPGRDSGFSDQHHAAVNGFPHPKTDEEAAISEEEIFADAEDSGEVRVGGGEV